MGGQEGVEVGWRVWRWGTGGCGGGGGGCGGGGTGGCEDHLVGEHHYPG